MVLAFTLWGSAGWWSLLILLAPALMILAAHGSNDHGK